MIHLLLVKLRTNLLRIFHQKFYKYRLAKGWRLEIVGKRDESLNGYYDKVITNEDDVILYLDIVGANARVAYLKDGIENIVEETSCWNYQQGNMLTWLDDHRFIYNVVDVKLGKYGAKIYNLKTGIKVISEFPVQAVSSCGKEYTSICYRNMAATRRDYGYFNLEPKISDFGFSRVKTDDLSQIEYISNAQLIKSCKIPRRAVDVRTNHFLYSIDGNSLVFLLRYNLDGNLIHNLVLYDSFSVFKILHKGLVSHYTWLSEHELCFFGEDGSMILGYHTLNVKTGTFVLNKSAVTSQDGHPVGINDHVILTDTYPDKSRYARLYWLDLENGEQTTIFEAYIPWRYRKEQRIDFHPKVSFGRDCYYFESGHEGRRRLYRLWYEK